MGKIIMASPKVIAVTFDQSNSMKNKYNEFIKNIASVNQTTKTVLDSDDSMVFDSSEKNTDNSLSGNDNLFSAQIPSETVTLNDNNSQGAITNPLNKAVNVAMQQVDGITLSNAELQELEDGLTEVIKIAELSIHSIIGQYREKGKKVNNQDLNSAVNEESAALNVDSTNIFDNPSDSKRIA